MIDEKKERNADVCRFYLAGHDQATVARHFNLSRARVHQILKRAGVWRPHKPSPRTEFLGVNINKSTKSALRRKAKEDGLSVSKLASDVLDAAVKAE